MHQSGTRRAPAALMAVVSVALWISSGAAAGEKIERRPEPANPAQLQEAKELRVLAAAYAKVFNAGDARKISTFWTPDGDYIDADGTVFRGRAAIEKEFAKFFAENKGVQIEIETEQVRFPAPGVAIEEGVARLRSPDETSTSTSRYTITHVKTDGRWYMASVRELPQQAASGYDRLRDLEWLVGTWTAKSGSRSVDVTCEWACNKNFLLRRYVVKEDGATLRKGIQVIGWDPINSRLRSWVFDGDGGFGEENWTADGKAWALEASGVQREGGKTQAINILTRVSPNSYTWQSVRRSIDGTSLPDTAVVTLSRVAAKK